MAETIESFVEKLQAEGVEAGRQEAQRIAAEARRQADQLLRQAEQKADKILAEAKAQGQDILNRARVEMELAARDAMLRLQEALSRGLRAVFAQRAGEHLQDEQFLGKLLHEIVLMYTESDFHCRSGLKIAVRPEMREKLIAWALREVGERDVERVRPGIDLKGTLADAGFEYTCSGSTVEVTRDSVVETLMDLVGPDLREMLRKAMAEETPAESQPKE